MGLQLTVLVMKVCITLSAMSVDGSSVRVSWPPRGLPTETPTVHPIGPGQPPLIQPDPAPSLTRTPPSSGRTRNGELAAAPSSKESHHSSSINHSPTKALHPQPVLKPPSIAVAPSASSFGSPARDWMHGPASSPSLSFYKHDYAMNGFGDSAPEPSYLIHQPADSQQVPAVSPSQYSIPSWVSPAPALSPTDPSRHFNMPTLQPAISPVGSSLENTKGSPAPVVMALPPPPPNKGLPASPPAASSSASAIDDGPYSGHDNHGEAIKPLGVDVPRKKTDGIRQSLIAVIILSCFSAFVVCLGIIWLILLKYGACVKEREHLPQAIKSSPEKPSGAGAMMQGSTSSAASMSIGSKGLTYTGLAKNFTLNDIERATNSFDASRVIGEGGFGIVYRGILDDGAPVAVKALKREDKRGGQEFLAEVEMLSRLHHRNLVKLIGICTEDNIRCLVYELVPNGSLESHLHGVDKETGPLDWGARMKIALGAARGLAYLHEDSSPRVIHRDFKSSNILLEHDFTPKVSDFGLARTALDEGNKYISTHVMGTFGYLAPEYAMTGHLLVKSDVYSYGVVLLELLTGRKPVDLSQPPGQENLVAWARPLLTATEGLETVIDPAIKSDVSFDSIAKVAAIASMCVQPEVSHRPFMGEVVQALKLVCNEFDEKKEVESKVCVQEDFPTTVDSLVSRLSSELVEASDTYHQVPGCDFSRGSNIALSASDFLSIPMGLEEQEPASFRRHSCSGPVGTGRRSHFWQRIRSLSRGSRSEHGFSVKFWPGSR
ncbi:Kinase superfamily protein isoform 4 [Theobroma cacao]|uniref:Kinase superfamily protein isoform 4 n=1 Tax=Theobroma cacao TaxID=3641 RepID=A0A061GJ93_THECC|nr:Kinase superfamily protein isoform 4 [Theobroma cacao]